VHPHGIDIGPVEQALVGGGVVGADALDQFILAQELGAALCRRLSSRRVFRLGGGLRRFDGEGL